MVEKKQVVIIGAGPAGLTAAYELLQKGAYDVTILEESAEIGGISRTVRVGGNRMDIGGHRFFSKDPQVMDWWSSMMPLQGSPSYDDKVLGRPSQLTPGGPDPEQADRVMLCRNRVSRIYYGGKFFDYPVSLKPETIRSLGFGRTVVAGCSYLKAMVLKKPEDSLENFYINRFGRKLYSMFFEGYTEKLWGRHPRDISADWGSQRVKGLSISAVIKDILHKMTGKKDAATETSLIESFWYPKYGPGQLWETVAQEIQALGGRICFGHTVRMVQCGDGAIQSVTCDTPEGQKRFSADVFLSSMPLKDLVAGMEGDEPSQDVKAIAAGLPYRDFVTVGLLVPKLNLKNKTAIKTLSDIVPDCWIYVQETKVKLGRIQIFNNWSPYMVERPAETVWIGLEYFCTEGDDFWNLSEADCVALAAGELEKMGIISAGEVLASHREKVKKAYPAYFDTYAQIDTLIQALDRYENLYCIGRNGQHRYNNMDHSMVTAMRAVDCITGAETDRSAVWKVNTEKSYHESKDKTDND